MSLQTCYEPINGEEGKKALIKVFKDKVELMPMMRLGNAYHQFKADVKIIISAIPADVPVPKLDFQTLIGLTPPTGETDEKIRKALHAVDKVEKLEEVEKSLLSALKKVQDTLNLVRPQEVIDMELNAGDKPDELRIATGQKIPMIQRTNSGMRQVYVDPTTIQTNSTSTNK